MKLLCFCIVFLVLTMPVALFSQENQLITSPLGELHVSVRLKESKIQYSVAFNEELLVDFSSLGLVFLNNDSLCKFELISVKHDSFDEIWTPVWGQYDSIRNNYNEMLVALQTIDFKHRLNIRFRVYDDGFAFRYEYPDTVDKITIISEESYINFADNYDSWWIWADYNTYEKLYNNTRISECEHVASPFTLKTSSGTHICVHEAAILNYSSMTLYKCKDDSTKFKVNLVPWADGTKVKIAGPFVTPWRSMTVVKKPGGLIESSLIYNLNEKPQASDYSWIKPIKYIGIWWEMHLGISEWGISNNRHGANTEHVKTYIDFAEDNGFDAVLVEGWNTGWEDWGKTNAFDFVSPYSDFDIDEIVKYAKERKIEIIGHHETGGDVLSYEQNLDKAFQYYEGFGIRYVKTGYAGAINPSEESHHGQYMVNHYNKVMIKALEYNIMLDVHEPIIPSGLARTYPNLMCFEGVRGMEWNAWSDGNPPSHTCVIPFTRGVAGPIDYTPGIFDINHNNYAEKRVNWNKYDNGNSATHSTIVNQIALMVVLYSPMLMAADLIENYSEHEAFDIVKQIPATWDDTKVLYSVIGECVVIARRSGNDWFVAGITNEEKRKIFIRFNEFLEPNKIYNSVIIRDHFLAHYETNPELFTKESKTYTSDAYVEIAIKEGGGFVMVFTQQD